MSTETLPWVCRITEYGKTAKVLATKAVVTGAIKSTGSYTKSIDPVECFQHLLGSAPKLDMKASFFGLTLKGLNACIHPAIMYGTWESWDGTSQSQPPLFYNGINQYSADIMSEVSKEIHHIAKGMVILMIHTAGS